MSTPASDIQVHPALRRRIERLNAAPILDTPRDNSIQVHRAICPSCSFDTGFLEGANASNKGEAHAARTGHAPEHLSLVHVRTIRPRRSRLDERR